MGIFSTGGGQFHHRFPADKRTSFCIGHNTYFVGCDEWGFSVWAHNSYGEFERIVTDPRLKTKLSTTEARLAYYMDAKGGEAALRQGLKDAGLHHTAIERAVAVAKADGLFTPPALAGVTPLLANEGKVGTYGHLVSKVGKPGDNLTPHHVPADAFMAAKVPGYKRSEGISIMMEQPAVGGRHRQTASYGRSPDLTRSPAAALAAEVADVRAVYKAQGHLTPQIEAALQQLIAQNKAKWPGTF